MSVPFDFDFDALSAMSEEELNKKYPHEKVLLRGERGSLSESIWVRRIDDSHVMVNNVPLHRDYNYADVVRCPKSFKAEIMGLVYRPFPNVYSFCLDEDTTGSDERRKIFEALSPFGPVSFLMSDLGIVQTKSDVTGTQVVSAVCSLGFVESVNDETNPDNVRTIWTDAEVIAEA